MFRKHEITATGIGPEKPKKTFWRRFVRSDDGAAAIEFAILSIPYFLIIFAILETCVAFMGEQVVSNAVEDMARKMRTGEIKSTMSRKDFRTAFCDEISVMISCSQNEIEQPDRLLLDVRTFASFAAVPATIPRVSSAQFADIKTSEIGYSPGGAKTINMLRAYYRWHIITDLLRPYITTIRPADGSMPTDFLIVATATFQNENYP